jgi:hypothetical protein
MVLLRLGLVNPDGAWAWRLGWVPKGSRCPRDSIDDDVHVPGAVTMSSGSVTSKVPPWSQRSHALRASPDDAEASQRPAAGAEVAGVAAALAAAHVLGRQTPEFLKGSALFDARGHRHPWRVHGGRSSRRRQRRQQRNA